MRGGSEARARGDPHGWKRVPEEKPQPFWGDSSLFGDAPERGLLLPPPRGIWGRTDAFKASFGDKTRRKGSGGGSAGPELSQLPSWVKTGRINKIVGFWLKKPPPRQKALGTSSRHRGAGTEPSGGGGSGSQARDVDLWVFLGKERKEELKKN